MCDPMLVLLQQEMKKIQGSDPDKRTVIAFGSYDYSENSFMDLYKNTFAAVVG